MERTYEDNVKIWKEAYTDILSVCKKYPEFNSMYTSTFDDIYKMKNSANDHLLLIDWYEKYGLKISHDSKPYSNHYLSMGSYTTFNRFGDAEKDKIQGSGKYIAWSDDGKQPNNEWLFIISFSTGAYIFGQDYDSQRQLFQDFFDELKRYKPDYSDSHNSSLYWRLENTKPIYDSFTTILKRYQDRNTSELKQREADKLRKQLEKLESDLKVSE